MLLVFDCALPELDGTIVEGDQHGADWVVAWEVDASDSCDVSHSKVFE